MELYSIDNYKLASKVSNDIWEKHLLKHPEYYPFNTLEDDLKLLPTDYLKDRYARCKRFMNKCFDLLDSNNPKYSELKTYLYRYELS